MKCFLNHEANSFAFIHPLSEKLYWVPGISQTAISGDMVLRFPNREIVWPDALTQATAVT